MRLLNGPVTFFVASRNKDLFLCLSNTNPDWIVTKVKLAEDSRRVRWALNACIPSQAPEIGHVLRV